jgi:hypothetical protein
MHSPAAGSQQLSDWQSSLVEHDAGGATQVS